MEGNRGQESGRTWGGRGTGDGRRKGRKWDLHKGEKFKKATVRYLFQSKKKKKHKPSNVVDFHLTFSEASNKILYARKRKFVLGLKNRISFGEIGNLLSHLCHWS